MSLITVDDDGDSWLTEYGAIERLITTINSSIDKRNCQNSTAEYNKISARIRIQFKQFDNEYMELEKKLGALKKITDAERERRLRNLEQLSTKKIQLNARFQNTASSSTRAKLFNEASSKDKLYNDGVDDDEPIISSNASVQQLRSEQKQIIIEQDYSLDNLSRAISRQKDIAIKIGGEVERQNEILDDIGDMMENTNSQISSTTRGVEEVSRKDSTWTYWLIIICLLVAIIIVLIL